VFALPLLLLVAAGPDAAGAPTLPATWIAGDGSTIAYHLVHKFHSVEGIARSVEAKVRLAPGGGAQFAVRARLAEFDSGNSNRDAHMMEVTEAGRFPYVTVKGAAEGVRVDALPADVTLPLRVRLELHGVSRELEVAARIHFASPQRAEVAATFPVSLTAHGVERPSLLFVKVDDRIEIVARLILVPGAP
jgi:hypothetical protein